MKTILAAPDLLKVEIISFCSNEVRLVLKTRLLNGQPTFLWRLAYEIFRLAVGTTLVPRKGRRLSTGKFTERSHFYLIDMTAFRVSPPVFFGLLPDASGIRGPVACATEGCCDRKKKELKCVQFYGSTTVIITR